MVGQARRRLSVENPFFLLKILRHPVGQGRVSQHTWAGRAHPLVFSRHACSRGLEPTKGPVDTQQPPARLPASVRDSAGPPHGSGPDSAKLLRAGPSPPPRPMRSPQEPKTERCGCLLSPTHTKAGRRGTEHRPGVEGMGESRRTPREKGAQGWPCPFPRIKGFGCREGPAQSFRQSRGGGFKEPQVTVHVKSMKSFPRSSPQPPRPLSPRMAGRKSPRSVRSRHGAVPSKTQAGGPCPWGACLPCSPEAPGEQAFLLRSWPESCSRGGLSPHRRALHSRHRLLVGLQSARTQRCRGVPAPNPNTLPVSWGNLAMPLDKQPGVEKPE